MFIITRRLASVFLAVVSTTSLYGQPWITGYYSAQNGVLPVSSIPWNKYTHIIHFAASTPGDGTVSLYRLSQAEINELTASKPAGKKLLVSIKDNDKDYNAFAQSTSAANIAKFVNNIVSFVAGNGYDGVDIDWEINVNANQFEDLLTRLRALMSGKVISIAGGPGLSTVAAGSQAQLDQINVLCYDLDRAHSYSWYLDPLLQNGNTNVLTCDSAVEQFTSAGVAPGKIGVGIPFYGRRWSGVTHVLQAASFDKTVTFAYRDLVTNATRWQPQFQFYDTVYKANYLSINIPTLQEFDSYTGPQFIGDAVSWQKSKGFGGFMTFTVEYEYLATELGDAAFPLSTTLYNAVFNTNVAPTIDANGVHSVANGSPANPPGSLIYATGTNLASMTLVASSTPLTPQIRTSSDDVSVTVNGKAAPMYYITPNAVSFQLPWETATGNATIVVTRNGVQSKSTNFIVGQFSPGIYTINGAGSGAGWAIFATTSKLDAKAQVAQNSNVGTYIGGPATAGDILYIHAAGLGPPKDTTKAVDGQAPCPLTNNVPGPCPAGYDPSNYATLNTPVVTIGGVPAKVNASILDPTFPGLYLVFFTVPSGTLKGSAVPVELEVGGVTTPNSVTIAVQ